MKHLSVFAIIPFLSVGVNRCKSYENDIDRCNPYNVFSDHAFSKREIDVPGYLLHPSSDVGDTLDGYILDAAPYTKVDTIEETGNDNHFKYTVYSTGFFSSAKFNLTFYDTGYVTVSTTKSVQDKSKESGYATVNISYDYQFDASKASRIFGVVNDLKEEAEARAAEAEAREKEKERINKELEEITFEDVMGDISKRDPLVITYCRSSAIEEQYVDITDDGSVIELLSAAQYSSTNKHYPSTYDDYAYITYQVKDQDGKPSYVYSFDIFEADRLIEIRIDIKDSYGVVYSKSMYYQIPRDTAHAIFDKLIEIYNRENITEENPTEDSSSNNQ